MATIKSFDDFTYCLGQGDFHQVWSLYEAARSEIDPEQPPVWLDFYSVEDASNGARIIKPVGGGDSLVLATPKAREAFLLHMQKFADAFGGDMEIWYGFQQAMENPKS